ncbi:MAG: DUF1015 domain-containing protein [Flavobacteriales bacterium]
MCAKVLPFRAVRPTRDKAHLVASRPYFQYKKNILKAKLEENPFTFIHIINPEFGKNDKTKPNSIERFRKVRSKYEEFQNKGIFLKEKKDSYYIYRQTQPGHCFTGIIAKASIEDYLQGKIKIHEQTITEREEIFKNYLDSCGFNAEPVLLTYPKQNDIDSILSKHTDLRPEYEFTTTDLFKHELWLVQQDSDVKQLMKAFSEIDAVYIADGHHRSGSSALLGEEKKKANPNHRGDESYNFFLAFYISDEDLQIFDFNRVVSNTVVTEKELLKRLSEDFEVLPLGKAEAKPSAIHEFIMYTGGNWYKLLPKFSVDASGPETNRLDSLLLTEKVLSPVFGIKDLKTDKRISFISGVEGTRGMKKQVDKNSGSVGFMLYPVSFAQLKAIADQKLIMPPKTTWIEPKLRSGLTIYEF